MNDTTSYVCLGTCQAAISEEQYKNGLTACGAEECTMKGKPFVEGEKCEQCGKNFEAGSQHFHNENQQQ